MVLAAVDFAVAWRLLGRDHFEDRGAIGLPFLFADSRDAFERGDARRAMLGERAQGGVTKHDVGGHALRARSFGTPCAKRFEEGAVCGIQTLGGRRLARSRRAPARPAAACESRTRMEASLRYGKSRGCIFR